MSVDKNQRVLTAAQKKEAIALFNQGLQTYTQISAKMRVPYQAVNTFMTKWKYKKGILLKRATRSDKKVRTERKTHQAPVQRQAKSESVESLQQIPDTSDIIRHSQDVVTKLILDELKFLREFYKSTVDSMQSVLLRDEVHKRNNAH